jgi:Family of unknown function (DUF6152)
MKRTLVPLLSFVPLVTGLLLMPGSANGHHGWAEFDEKAEVTLEGTVTDFHYVNPHCVVEFEVKDERGRIQKWQGEFSNPGVLSRKGWTAASLESGDKLTITGHPARKGVFALHVTKIRLSSGEVKLDLRE